MAHIGQELALGTIRRLCFGEGVGDRILGVVFHPLEQGHQKIDAGQHSQQPGKLQETFAADRCLIREGEPILSRCVERHDRGNARQRPQNAGSCPAQSNCKHGNRHVPHRGRRMMPAVKAGQRGIREPGDRGHNVPAKLKVSGGPKIDQVHEERRHRNVDDGTGNRRAQDPEDRRKDRPKETEGQIKRDHAVGAAKGLAVLPQSVGDQPVLDRTEHRRPIRQHE